jgi:hypothetical protein
MNRYHLYNWSTKTRVVINAISWEIENYQHTFYQLSEEIKVVTQSYTTRYYVVENVEYNINKE